MKFSPKQYALALNDAINDTSPKDTDIVLDNFVKVLAENNDLRLFNEIADELHKLDLKKKGITQAEVVSAKQLSRENEHQIINVINQYVAGKIELKKKLDEGLIGGCVIQANDLMIDASIKKSLEQLRENMQE